MSFDWKLMLKEQQDDLARMERLDAAMNMDQNDLVNETNQFKKKSSHNKVPLYPCLYNGCAFIHSCSFLFVIYSISPADC